ncbi:MAG: CDP-alcohol phosphatidyltransferase family protein [Proteobacteria bacterium]|nr:CDP-alcohol phosphatidyltransferase family protein [Pseudomonadota bacterium]
MNSDSMPANVVQEGPARASWGTLPNLLSLVRIPMGVLVWFHAHEPKFVAAMVVAAAVSDALDGWVARSERSRLAPDKAKAQSDLGAWLDPFCDKVFVLSTAAAIAWAHEAPIHLMLLVVTREILLTPFLVGYRAMPVAWRRSRSLTARWPGKLCTVAQFVACALAMVSSPALATMAWLSAILGLLAVAHYVATALTHHQP